MSAPSETKIFGMKIKLDRKILIGALGVFVVLMVWWNLRSSGDDAAATAPVAAARQEADTTVATPAAVGRPRVKTRLRTIAPGAADRGLKIRSVDASDGRIDPTLRIDLLTRVRAVAPIGPGRSLFETAAAPPVQVTQNIQGPKIPLPPPTPAPHVQTQITPPKPMVNIPLKYYGFARPASKGDVSRGLFMEGDNILVAKEGEALEGRFLVVELKAESARVEDTQLRQGQILPVMPEVPAQ